MLDKVKVADKLANVMIVYGAMLLMYKLVKRVF